MNVIDLPKRPTNLDKVIKQITSAMQGDYPQQFERTYPSGEDKASFIRRLHTYFKDKNLQDIMTAYDDYVHAGNKFLPNVPELLGLIDAAAKTRRQTEANREEALRIANTPAPTIQCDPLEMLKTAKEALKTNPQTKEERLAERLEALKAHERLLDAHRDKIRKHHVEADHQCHIAYCDKPGSLSNGTTGKGNFYCAEHFREMG